MASAVNNSTGNYATYFILLALGIGNLLPFNAFIASAAYYKVKFCSTEFHSSFENFFAITYTVAQPIGLFLTLMLENRISVRSLVLYPLLVYAFIFALNSIFIAVNSIPAANLFALTLMSTFLCGLAGAIMNGGLFALSGMLPFSNTAALMNGAGVAGFAVALLNMLISIISPPNVECNDDDQGGDDSDTCSKASVDYGALAFFLISTTALLICVILFLVLIRLPYVIEHTKNSVEEKVGRSHSKQIDYSTNDSKPVTTHNPIVPESSNGNTTDNYNAEITPSKSPTNWSAMASFCIELPSPTVTDDNRSYQESLREALSDVIRVSYIIRRPALAVFVAFFAALSVYPALTVLLKSTQYCQAGTSQFYTAQWIPFTFLLFNTSDLTGRLSAQFTHHHKQQPASANRITKAVHVVTGWIDGNNIHYLALAGLLWPILLIFCNIDDSQLGKPLQSDAVALNLIALLGYSNGFVGNLSMIFGPELAAAAATDAPVTQSFSSQHTNHGDDSRARSSSRATSVVSMHIKDDSALAGTIMVFALSSGLLCGSAVSFLVLYGVTGSVA